MEKGVSCKLPLELSGVESAWRAAALTFGRRGHVFSVARWHSDHLIDGQLQLVPAVLCGQNGLSSEILSFTQSPSELKQFNLVVVKAHIPTKGLGQRTRVEWSTQASASPGYISHVVEV